jgi:hypothetical protein
MFFFVPKMACLPSNHWVGPNVMKNCDPLVFGPELAIDKIPAPEKYVSHSLTSLALETLY